MIRLRHEVIKNISTTATNLTYKLLTLPIIADTWIARYERRRCFRVSKVLDKIRELGKTNTRDFLTDLAITGNTELLKVYTAI